MSSQVYFDSDYIDINIHNDRNVHPDSHNNADGVCDGCADEHDDPVYDIDQSLHNGGRGMVDFDNHFGCAAGRY